ncbi:MAG: tetratricopeptide repeat protein [Candidatus Eremiobacteraeota bacterium]|nr:tetratricopeptide repeat protein [Candidatus Eremiobacteraeota bacterium]
MIRRALPALILLALPLGVVFALPSQAGAVTLILPAESRTMADQQAAVTYARELIAAGDMDRAVAGLADFVATHPEATEAARFLGDLYYRQGHFDRAETVYKQLIARNPHDKQTHNRLGVVYATEDRIDDAIVQFEDALPGTDSIRDLVFLHLRKGDLQQYETEMVRAGTQDPNDADIQEELGEIFETLHRPNEAILYFRRALDSDARSIAALNGVGMAYLDLHDWATATEYLSDCLAIDALNYACLDNLGVARIQSGNYGAALARFKRAHQLEPERPEALVNFGYLEDQAGDWKRAVTYYVQAIAVDPYVPESYVNLGIDYEHNALYSLAQSALLKGVAAAPYDGRIRYLLARAYAAQGQKALALAQLKAAQNSLDPDVAQIAKEESARLMESSEAPQ